MSIDEVYELIDDLRKNRETRELANSYLTELLLSALGDLGYTVPGDTKDNAFRCGLCHARAREVLRTR